MARINTRNHGTALGRLAADPRFFDNSDGSRTVRFTVLVDQDFTDRNGERGTDPVPVERFIPANRDNGVFDMIHKGDLVEVSYRVTTDSYVDRAGERHFATKLIVSDVQMLESRKTTTDRLAKRVATQDAYNRAAQLAAPAAPAQAAPAQPQASVYDDMQSPYLGIADQDNPPF